MLESRPLAHARGSDPPPLVDGVHSRAARFGAPNPSVDCGFAEFAEPIPSRSMALRSSPRRRSSRRASISGGTSPRSVENAEHDALRGRRNIADLIGRDDLTGRHIRRLRVGGVNLGEWLALLDEVSTFSHAHDSNCMVDRVALPQSSGAQV